MGTEHELWKRKIRIIELETELKRQIAENIRLRERIKALEQNTSKSVLRRINAQLEAEVDALREANARGDFANERLREIERKAKLVVQFGEPELIDELEALLEGKEQE